MLKSHEFRWSGYTIIKFLNIYKKHEILWNASNENHFKKIAREHSFTNLVQDLLKAGFQFSSKEGLKRKIKNIKDTYRLEVKKIKKAKRLFGTTSKVFKSKLVWFETADAFLRNIASRSPSKKQPSSSLVSFIFAPYELMNDFLCFTVLKLIKKLFILECCMITYNHVFPFRHSYAIMQSWASAAGARGAVTP